MDLKIDPKRSSLGSTKDGFRYYPLTDPTQIFVRAQGEDGTWHSVDIACLDRESLLRWLRSRGGSNEWAESVVLILLKHPSVTQGGPVVVVNPES